MQGRVSFLISKRGENRVRQVFCKCSPPMSIKNLRVQAAVKLDENFPISKRVIAFATQTHGLVKAGFYIKTFHHMQNHHTNKKCHYFPDTHSYLKYLVMLTKGGSNQNGKGRRYFNIPESLSPLLNIGKSDSKQSENE